MKPRILPIISLSLAVSSVSAISQTPAGVSGYFGSSTTDRNSPIAAAGQTPVQVQTFLEREFTQLQEQHEKALATSAETIHRRYLSDLESLLFRAEKANEVQATNRISVELQRIRSGMQLGSEASKLTVNDFTASLVGTKWIWYGGETITFLTDGQIIWNRDKIPWFWKVLNPKKLTVVIRNMDKKKDATITFNSDLQTGIIEGDDATRETKIIK